MAATDPAANPTPASWLAPLRQWWPAFVLALAAVGYREYDRRSAPSGGTSATRAAHQKLGADYATALVAAARETLVEASGGDEATEDAQVQAARKALDAKMRAAWKPVADVLKAEAGTDPAKARSIYREVAEGMPK